MRTISIRLPDSLHRQVRALAVREGVSFNQLVALALAEKVFAVMTEDERSVRALEGGGDLRRLFPGIVWSDDADAGEESR
jgi:hypothetical protein